VSGSFAIRRVYGTDTTTTTLSTDTLHDVNVRSKEQRPNRFTSIYNQMQGTCPEPIELYAQCVIAAQQQPKEETATTGSTSTNNCKSGGSTYQTCATEFAAVKECFRTVRHPLRLGRQ
jgi:hypothetical protein